MVIRFFFTLSLYFMVQKTFPYGYIFLRASIIILEEVTLLISFTCFFIVYLCPSFVYHYLFIVYSGESFLLWLHFFLTVDSVNFHIRISEIFFYQSSLFFYYDSYQVFSASSLTFSNARLCHFFLHFVFFSQLFSFWFLPIQIQQLKVVTHCWCFLGNLR